MSWVVQVACMGTPPPLPDRRPVLFNRAFAAHGSQLTACNPQPLQVFSRKRR